MQPEKLDRNLSHRINANPPDTVYLWQTPGSQNQNLTIRSKIGNDVLTIYGLTNEQLGALYLEIAGVLGKCPACTIHHLREIGGMIEKLIRESEPPSSGEQDGKSDFFDSRFSE